MARTKTRARAPGVGEQRFSEVVEAFASDPRLAPVADAFLAVSNCKQRKGFGSSALKVQGKIFAMLVDERLVVKLPRDRVDALVAENLGKHFDPGHGRLMREWFAVRDAKLSWIVLAKDAHDFVSRSAR
jgi:hypothetical protein